MFLRVFTKIADALVSLSVNVARLADAEERIAIAVEKIATVMTEEPPPEVVGISAHPTPPTPRP